MTRSLYLFIRFQVEDEKKAGGVFSEINKAILSQTIKNDIWLENNFDWYTKLAESKDQTAAQDPEVITSPAAS